MADDTPAGAAPRGLLGSSPPAGTSPRWVLRGSAGTPPTWVLRDGPSGGRPAGRGTRRVEWRALATRPAVMPAAAFVALVAWIVFFMLTRPDLQHPTAIGSDTSNYYAAGLRLNAGHPLYALGRGDRPVPLEPPYYHVPLLSPPPVAVLWRLLAIVPGDLVMTAWWMAGGLLLAATAAWLARRATLRGALVFQLAAAPVALTVWSGNVNAYLAALLSIAWIAHARGRPVVAGAIAGITVATKLTPALLLVWFLVRGDRRGAVAMLVAGGFVALLSVLGAGVANQLAYLDVVRDTATAGVTPWSLPGMLAHLGVPEALARLGPMLAAVGGGLLIVVLRRRPVAGFTVALLAGIWSTPVVHLVGMSLLLPAVAAHLGEPAPEAEPARMLAAWPAEARRA